MTKSTAAFLSVLLSAFTFAFVTVGVKHLTAQNWPPLFLTFGRFSIGAICLIIWFFWKKQSFKANNFKFVAIRSISNVIAVSFFYLSIHYTTITKANLLNMTYPIFMAFLAPILLKEKSNTRSIIAVLIAFVGIYILLGTDIEHWQKGDLFGLICGFIAAFSLMSLRKSRIYDRSDTVLLYVMMVGSICLLPFIELPKEFNEKQFMIFICISLGGLLGQLFLTYGYGHIKALTGAIASTSRVIFAVILGYSFFGEVLDYISLAGSCLIIFGILLMSSNAKDKTNDN